MTAPVLDLAPSDWPQNVENYFSKICDPRWMTDFRLQFARGLPWHSKRAADYIEKIRKEVPELFDDCDLVAAERYVDIRDRDSSADDALPPDLREEDEVFLRLRAETLCEEE